MLATIIGISSGFFLIILFGLLKQFNKRLIYGLILTAIGFIYVGFVWRDTQDLVIKSTQGYCISFYRLLQGKTESLCTGYWVFSARLLGYNLPVIHRCRIDPSGL